MAVGLTNKRKVELFLFVWSEFCPDHTGGLAFAIAENVEEARNMVIDKMGYDYKDWGNLKQYSLNDKVCYAIAGGS